nr:Hsp70 family protein [Kitasatospora sp. MBT66]
MGIALGPTFCSVAVQEGARIEIVPNGEGAERTPSVVALTGTAGDRVLVGEPALRQELLNPEGTYRLAGADVDPVIADRVCTALLAKLKRDTEDRLGERVARATFVVPAATSEAERRRIRRACRAVGIEPLRFISTSLAAGMAFDRQVGDRESTLLVVGLEATSLEVAVVEVGYGMTFVNAIALGEGIGSDRWVARLADDLLTEFEHRHGVRLDRDPDVRRRVQEAAGAAMAELGSVGETTVHLPYLADTPAGPAALETPVTRERFDRITADLLTACATTVDRALAESWREDIEHVLLVGAGARIPGVGELARRAVGRQDVNAAITADTQLATGAMLHAGMMTKAARDVLGVDIAPRAIGIETEDGLMRVLVPASTSLPTKRSEIFTSSSVDQPGTNINVYQGGHELAARNSLLASFRLSGLPPAPLGLPQIEVTADIDANGRISVSAKDLGTGRSETLTDITGSEPPTVPLFGDLPAEFRPPDPVEEEEPPRQQQKQS